MNTSIHSLRYSLIYLNDIYSFSLHRSWVIHIFYDFVTVTFFSISNCPLLIYRNSVGFCILIWYSLILTNSLICSNILCISHRICYIDERVISKGQFWSFFLSNMAYYFLFLSCFVSFITLARLFSTTLNRDGESWHLVLHLKGKHSVFHLKYDAGCRFCMNVSYQVVTSHF